MTLFTQRQSTKAVYADLAPQITSADGKEKTWITRAGRFAICYSELEAGAVLTRANEPEESMLIIPPEGASVTIAAGGESVDAEPDSLTILPPGENTITVKSGGQLARLVSVASTDIMDLAHNAETYADGAPELAPVDLWPAPTDGFKIRHYPMAKYIDANGPRIQPRCFRSTNMLVNLFGYYNTRRGGTGLSPHWHDDFEQASLCFKGTWVHHMRHNWGADSALWWPDDHQELATPSTMIIPARSIHTSQDVGEDGPESSLYDLFCPPRMDFASKPGFCINEDEYPLPDMSDAAEVKTGGTLLDWQKPKGA